MRKSLSAALLILLASSLLAQSPPTLTVDAASPTGIVRHGATGWLYGQSEPGIPPVPMMALLKPQISAQKPPAGLQHPGGDALEVMPSFKAAGGHLMQIYIQDIYPDWPYNDNGLDDYLKKIAIVAHKVVADPNRSSFVYVPFNEPDNNWYGYSGPKFDRFLHDWLAVYRRIRSIDPAAKIAGPNYEHFKPATYEAFFTFARNNHALPDETTWHELHADFFTDWYQRYAAYRALEKQLDIAPIPVVINEYTRDKGDLAVPGNLVQWITRFESSKVDACLAYWTPAGTMSDLTARTWPNRATGAWWVFHWYADMVGQTLKVTPPDLNAIGLQGIASADRTTRQLRILFGGSSGADINLTGLPTWLQTSAHLALYRVDSSSIQPSPGPQLVSQSELPIREGRTSFSAPPADATSAWYAILTPSPAAVLHAQTGHYPAIYASFSESAVPLYRNDPGAVRLNTAANATFTATAENDGYYTVTLRYLAKTTARLNLRLNDIAYEPLTLPPSTTIRPFAEIRNTLYLAAGINAFYLAPVSGSAPAGIELISLDLAPATRPIAAYKSVGSNPATFPHVSAPTAGRYKLIVTYSNDEKGHRGAVDELANISVNGSRPIPTYFRNTFDPTVFCTTVVDIELKTGDNTIAITPAPGQRGPNLSQIQIAKAVLD